MERKNNAPAGGKNSKRHSEEIFPVAKPVEPVLSKRQVIRVVMPVILFAILLVLSVRVILPGVTRSAFAQPNSPAQAVVASPVPPERSSTKVVRTVPPLRPSGRLTLAAEPNKLAAPAAADEQAEAEEPAPIFNPADWRSLPVIPEVSETARQIYLRGQELGNDASVFSKIGDCNSLSVRYLTYYDYESIAYDLGDYTALNDVIEHFKGSFTPLGQAVGDGYNTSTVLSPFRADINVCKVNESPLECEYRLRRPSFVLVAIGTDDVLSNEKFEANMRKIIEISIEEGVVPILSTLPDKPVKEDYNTIIATLAYEYDIPLWNLWRAHQPVVNEGMADDIHPSGEFAAFHFTEDNLANWGWSVRNLTALQALDAVWQGVSN